MAVLKLVDLSQEEPAGQGALAEKKFLHRGSYSFQFAGRDRAPVRHKTDARGKRQPVAAGVQTEIRFFLSISRPNKIEKSHVKNSMIAL